MILQQQQQQRDYQALEEFLSDLAWEAWLGSCRQYDQSCDNTDIGRQGIQIEDIPVDNNFCSILNHSWMRKKDEQQ